MELIAVFTPLCAFIAAFLFGKDLGERGAVFITCSGVILAALASVILFFDVIMGSHPYTTVLATWISSGDFTLEWALRVDQLSVVMMCVINIVSACVHVYSVGYMSHDPHKIRFMSYLSLFTFAMLMLVSADNLLQLFFGWEGVGLASYLLIGFWNHKQSANAAAQKAFVVNRVGDFGLALGIMAVFVLFGSIDFGYIFEQAPNLANETIRFFGFDIHALTLICLLLFMGAVGKSAQLGLHTWLPDAMEGPTPVSALIHAATMVTAGVFLVARFSPVFEYAPAALVVVTVFGALTAIVAATIGLTQFDIKRVIAYSTMSQLGYMFFALGVSAYGAAMFHLMTHAFFKALLFLGAGSVIHAMSDEQDMRNMGGIWRKIPVTYTLMWIGSLALAGIWPFAGYFSKDIMLEAAWADHTWFGDMAFWLGITAAFLTAFYSWRLLFMAFHGKPRASKKVMEHVHESPGVMLGPLFVLATGAVLAGFVFYGGFVGSASHGESHEVIEVEADHTSDHAAATHEEGAQETSVYDNADVSHEEATHSAPTQTQEETSYVEKEIYEETHEEPASEPWAKSYFWDNALFVLPENDTVEAGHHAPFWVKKLPLLMGALGIFFAYLMYIVKPSAPAFFTKVFSPLHKLFFNKWYFDELYNAVFVKNAIRLGQVFLKYGDQGTIDRFGPDGGARASQKMAGILSRFQSGFVYQYAFVMMIAVIGVISWFVFRSLVMGE